MVIPNYIEDGIIYIKMGCYVNYKCSLISDIITLTASADGDFSRMREKTVTKGFKTLMELTKCFRSSASLNLAWEIS